VALEWVVNHRTGTNFTENFGEEYVSTFHLCNDFKAACDIVRRKKKAISSNGKV
jgi:hypothetical protein